jgi:hypothetical protein
MDSVGSDSPNVRYPEGRVPRKELWTSEVPLYQACDSPCSRVRFRGLAETRGGVFDRVPF